MIDKSRWNVNDPVWVPLFSCFGNRPICGPYHYGTVVCVREHSIVIELKEPSEDGANVRELLFEQNVWKTEAEAAGWCSSHNKSVSE